MARSCPNCGIDLREACREISKSVSDGESKPVGLSDDELYEQCQASKRNQASHRCRSFARGLEPGVTRQERDHCSLWPSVAVLGSTAQATQAKGEVLNKQRLWNDVDTTFRGLITPGKGRVRTEYEWCKHHRPGAENNAREVVR